MGPFPGVQTSREDCPILHPVSHSLLLITPYGHFGVTSAHVPVHMLYWNMLTKREQPELTLRGHSARHELSVVPRTRIMHAWEQDSIWLLPTVGSLQHRPSDWQNAVHCA